MNRSRPPRRAATRRGRSREPSPVREVEGTDQEVPIDESTSDPPQRRSTRSRRGTPTPPLETNEPDQTDGGTVNADNGPSQAQHPQQETEATKTGDENDEVKNDVSPPRRPPPTLDVTTDNGEPSNSTVSTVSQDTGASKDVPDSNDRGIVESRIELPNGDRAGKPNGAASANPEPGTGNVSVPHPADRRDSRTISLGSKSAMEAVDGGGNDHAEPTKVAASPSVSLDSRNESPNEHDGIVKGAEMNANDTLVSATATYNTNDTSFASSGVRDDLDQAKGMMKSEVEGRTGDEATGNKGTAPNEQPADEHQARSDAVAGSASIPIMEDKIDGDNGSGAAEGANVQSTAGESKPDDVDSMPTPEVRNLNTARLEKAVSNPVVVNNAFAIDIRPTVKNAKVRRLPSGGRPETAQSSVAIETETLPRHESVVNVEGNISTMIRKHTINDAARTIKGAPNSHEARLQPKRRRTEVAATTTSGVMRRQRQRRRRPRTNSARTRVSNGTPSTALLPNVADAESIKIRLFDVASRVHRGKGPERRFAEYWSALSKFLSFQVHPGVSFSGQSNLGGVHEVLDSFLITKQMRKLHNLLIMGLLSECTKESLGPGGLEAVPVHWRQSVTSQSVDSLDTLGTDSDLPLVSSLETEATFDLSDFDIESDVWTAAGGEPLISLDCGEGKHVNALINNSQVEQAHRHSPRLPGALSVDPRVREIVRGESSLKVSETAVWLLVVSVREYVQSLLKDTVSNMASADTEQSVEAIEFAQSAARSGNMGGVADKKKAGKGKKAPSKTKVAAAGGKKRRISSLDIASALSGTRMSTRESLGGSVSGMGYDRCVHAPLLGNWSQLSALPAFDTVQSFVVDSIESVAKKPKHEWRDPTPFPSPPDPLAAQSPSTPKASNTSPKKRTSSSRSPTGGSRQEATNLAFLQARAVAASVATVGSPAAAASTPAARAPAPTVPLTMTNASPAIPATPPAKTTGHQAGARELNITPPVATRPSPPPQTISPRGRGKGFGVKDLAALRARNTPPDKGTPPLPAGNDTRADGSGQSTTVAVKQNGGAGKELRRLQEAEVRKGNSPEASNTAASPNVLKETPVLASPVNPPEQATVMSPPIVPVTREPNAMDTST